LDLRVFSINSKASLTSGLTMTFVKETVKPPFFGMFFSNFISV